MRDTRILIAGCGDIGTALALKLCKLGAEVHGLRRTINQLPAPIHPLAIDLAQPIAKGTLPSVDYVIYTPAAKSQEAEVYRAVYLQGLEHLLAALPTPPKRLFYVSSTGVYGQHDHEWVNEESPAEPLSTNGQLMRQGEQRALQSAPATIVRFSGIYGPGRNHLRKMLEAGMIAEQTPVHYSNRIHRDDCVGVLNHLLQLAHDGQELDTCYLASDDKPTPIHEVMHYLAELYGLQPTATRPVGRGGSKRCSNRRLKATGYQFIYPDYRAGFAAD